MKQKFDIKEKLIDDIRDFKAPVLAEKVLKNEQEAELVSLALDKDLLLSSRAMWVLGHCSNIDYKRIKPFYSQLIDNLNNKGLHNGVIRNTLGLFQKHPVPEEYEAFVLDMCYKYIKNPSEAIAVRAFAITVAYNISKHYPELLEELSMVLHHLIPTEETPAIKARIKNTLKMIVKLEKNR